MLIWTPVVDRLAYLMLIYIFANSVTNALKTYFSILLVIVFKQSLITTVLNTVCGKYIIQIQLSADYDSFIFPSVDPVAWKKWKEKNYKWNSV